jgi:large subunit ribosomal protein L23
MNKQRLYTILRAPHVSEKSTLVGGHGNQYVFQVAKDASKPEIKAAVEMLFDVAVENVNVVNVKGKTKAFKQRLGKRPDWKKAYVRVQEGQTIDFDVAAQ